MKAYLLMSALFGVMRGLKAQETALEARLPTENWRRTLDQVLDYDLANSRTYQLTPTALILEGFAGRDAQSGKSNWMPTTIVYSVVDDGNQTWLVRQEMTNAKITSQELVLAGIMSIRVGGMNGNDTQTKTAIADGLAIEFWGSDARQPIYAYQFRRQ